MIVVSSFSSRKGKKKRRFEIVLGNFAQNEGSDEGD